MPQIVGRCQTCGRDRNRSSEQNRLYWAYLQAIAEQYRVAGQQFTSDTWHWQCRKQWLGSRDVTLPSGEVITVPNSTAKLSVDEFGDYLDKIAAWATTRGIWLEE